MIDDRCKCKLETFMPVLERYERGEIIQEQAAQMLGISIPTFCRLKTRLKKGLPLYDEGRKERCDKGMHRSRRTNDADGEDCEAVVRQDSENWLREKRIAKGLTLSEMAKACQCSERLLDMLEHGYVTHPHIASRVAKRYGLKISEYNAIVPQEHRRTKLPDYIKPPKETGLFWSNYVRKVDCSISSRY